MIKYYFNEKQFAFTRMSRNKLISK